MAATASRPDGLKRNASDVSSILLQVQPGQGNKADLSDMRSLSGGERSFSTVCFVLSLWAITEAPFRCLDEFDVYMVTRDHFY